MLCYSFDVFTIIEQCRNSTNRELPGGAVVKGAVPPETLGSRPGSVVTGRDREVRGATHNWPSVVRVREGLAGREILVSSRTRDSCAPATPVAGRAQCALTKVARCTVFPPTHWCSWLPGWMCAVLRSSAAWLGCVSEDARLSTFVSPEPYGSCSDETR